VAAAFLRWLHFDNGTAREFAQANPAEKPRPSILRPKVGKSEFTLIPADSAD
jgi:hypothetical protein